MGLRKAEKLDEHYTLESTEHPILKLYRLGFLNLKTPPKDTLFWLATICHKSTYNPINNIYGNLVII
jgi:hypothetical protein